MAATSRSAKKPMNILDKKVPENPKYKNVKCTVDTGASITRHLEREAETRKNFRYNKDEIFKRMSADTFAQLVLQVAQVSSLELQRDELESAGRESVFSEASTAINISDEKEASQTPVPSLDLSDTQLDTARTDTAASETSRSTLSGVISGVGEMDIKDQENLPQNAQETNQAPSIESMPYLLLDVRDKECFDRCHIIGAINYPSSMLSRAYNYFTKEITMFKNKMGKIIIVYDEDERLAASVATTFVQREVDNVFMLSGGLKVLAKRYPDGLISGPLPSSCIPTPPPSRRSAGKPASRKQASPVVDVPIKHPEFFTVDDLEKVQDCLDQELLRKESSRMSSRLSARSAMSTASTASNASSKSKPWK